VSQTFSNVINIAQSCVSTNKNILILCELICCHLGIQQIVIWSNLIYKKTSLYLNKTMKHISPKTRQYYTQNGPICVPIMTSHI